MNVNTVLLLTVRYEYNLRAITILFLFASIAFFFKINLLVAVLGYRPDMHTR